MLVPHLSRPAVRHRGPVAAIGPRLPDDRGRRRSPWLGPAVAAAGAAPFLLIALVLAVGNGETPPVDHVPPEEPAGSTAELEPDQAAVARAEEYAAGIQATALAAGRIIELEIKPGITDIREQAYDAQTLKGFSDRWAADFADLRDGLAAIQPPADVVGAHELYVDALDGYREVSLLLSSAAEADDADREPILQRAIDLGEATDEVWDTAQDMLAAYLRTLDLDPTRWLPVSGA